jgi:hypothetical protein
MEAGCGIVSDRPRRRSPVQHQPEPFVGIPTDKGLVTAWQLKTKTSLPLHRSSSTTPYRLLTITPLSDCIEIQNLMTMAREQGQEWL